MITSRASFLIHKLTESAYGCLMAPIPSGAAGKIVEFSELNIESGDAVGNGIERFPHITVLYGFLPGVGADDISFALQKHGVTRIEAKLGVVTRFVNSPEHDVLKIGVVSDDLHRVNDLLRKEFQSHLEITYPDYTPHLTLAYVRKGACPHIDNHAYFSGDIFTFKELVFKTPGAKETSTIPLI